jgi:hypothetical protein
MICLVATCSINLQAMHVRDMGLQLTALCLSLFFNIVSTLTCFQSCGLWIQELHSTNNSNIQTDLVIMDFAKVFDNLDSTSQTPI